MNDADRLAYLRAIVLHRCPELTDDELVLMAEPDGTLPLEVAEQILTVLDALQDRWEALAESLRQKPHAKTVISAAKARSRSGGCVTPMRRVTEGGPKGAIRPTPAAPVGIASW